MVAAKKITGSGRGENQDLILNITLYADPESVKEVVGDDMGGHYVVAQVNVQPKYGKEIVIDRDDFVAAHRQKRRADPSHGAQPDRRTQRAGDHRDEGRPWAGVGAQAAAGAWAAWAVGGGDRRRRCRRGPSKVKATMEQNEKENPLKSCPRPEDTARRETGKSPTAGCSISRWKSRS